ncbi:hypothetical protein ABIA41_005994 [Bradyrhizobium sp. USDA 313]
MSKTREAAVHTSRELPREQPMPRFDYQKPPTLTKGESSIKRATLSTERSQPSTRLQKFRSLQNLHF